MIFEPVCYKCDRRPSEKGCEDIRAKYREKGYNYYCECGGIIECVKGKVKFEFRKGLNCQKEYRKRKKEISEMILIVQKEIEKELNEKQSKSRTG